MNASLIFQITIDLRKMQMTFFVIYRTIIFGFRHIHSRSGISLKNHLFLIKYYFIRSMLE